MVGAAVIEALLQAERLLMYGMADQAEQIYASALEQDPLNAIAVVGLARVALERGDDQLAYAHARRALDIDPQNAAAVRLEQRLAEVFAAQAQRQAPEPATAHLAAEVRPSERVAFTRNPSMAEHQHMEQMRERVEPAEVRETAPVTPTERRPGFFRRLRGE